MTATDERGGPGEETSGRAPPGPPPGTSRRGAGVLSVVAALLALAALYVPPLGVPGMAAGALAHIKGMRAGLYLAAAAGVSMVVGSALVFLTG